MLKSKCVLLKQHELFNMGNHVLHDSTTSTLTHGREYEAGKVHGSEEICLHLLPSFSVAILRQILQSC